MPSIAEKKGVLLNFEAAVAGGIPVIKTLREALAGNTRHPRLRHPQRHLQLHPDPDGERGPVLRGLPRGRAAARLCRGRPDLRHRGQRHRAQAVDPDRLAFGTQIAADDIYVEGISNITPADIRAAAELGYRIKLLGVAQRTDSGIEQRVHPTMVPTASVIAQVHGVTNAVAIETDILGELLLSGPGAGGNATASAVIGDIADIAKSRPGFQHGPVFGRPAKELKPYKQAQMHSHAGGYFIRLTVHDRTGVFAAIAKRMADNDISLESIVQHSAERRDDATRRSSSSRTRRPRRRCARRRRHQEGRPSDRQAAGHPHRAAPAERFLYSPAHRRSPYRRVAMMDGRR